MKLNLDLDSLSPSDRNIIVTILRQTAERLHREITNDLNNFWSNVSDDSEVKQEMIRWQKAIGEFSKQIPKG